LLRNLSDYGEKYARHIVYTDDGNWIQRLGRY